MKVLLDECVTKHLIPYLDGYDVHTIKSMGWSGVKNGRLMKLCNDFNFDLICKNFQTLSQKL